MENQREEFELDLIELFYFLKKRVWIMLVSLVACAVAGFVAGQLLITPQYVASTRMYVLNRSTNSGIAYTDFQISSQLHDDYKVLITGQNVTKEVINQLGLDMTPAALAAKINVTAPENTRVLQINITDTDPQRAAAIANAVREVAAEQIQKITEADAVKLVYEADVPQSPVGSGVTHYALLAAILGLVASIVILVVIFLVDDTIRTEEDVERHLGLSTLGVIPISTDLSTPSAKPINKQRLSGSKSTGSKK